MKSQEYSIIFEKLDLYKELEDNWDGYNAPKLSNRLINVSYTFIKMLERLGYPSPKIMTSGYEIGLFWEDTEKGNYLEIIIEESEVYSYILIPKDKFNIYGEEDISCDIIPSKLDSYILSFL